MPDNNFTDPRIGIERAAEFEKRIAQKPLTSEDLDKKLGVVRTPNVAIGISKIDPYSDPSRYDKGLFNKKIPLIYGEDMEEMYALGQSSGQKIANGLIKMGGIAGATVLGTFSNLVFGLPYAIGEGSLSAFIDNPVSKSLDEFNEKMENWFPNFYTHKETNAAALDPDNWFTANFLGDKFLKNAGFTIGAITAGMITGGIMTGLSGATKVGKAVRFLNKLAALEKEGKIISSGAQMTKAIASANQSLKLAKGANLVLSAINSSHHEAALEARETGKAVYEMLLEKGHSADEARDMANEAMNVGFGINAAVLSVSEAVQFGRLFNRGFKSDIKHLNKIISGEAGALTQVKPGWLERNARYMTPILTESFEEGSQFGSAESIKHYYDKHKNNKESVDGLIESFHHGLHKLFTTKEGGESLLLGALTGGIFGGATNAYMNKKHGTTPSQIAKRTEDFINTLQNERINNPESAAGQYLNKTLKHYVNAIKNADTEAAMAKAIVEKDAFGYKNAEFKNFSDLVKMHSDSGTMDILLEDINSATGLSNEEIQELWGKEIGVDFAKGKTHISQVASELVSKAKKLHEINEHLKYRFPDSKTFYFYPKDKDADPSNIVGINKRDHLYDDLALLSNLEERERALSSELFAESNGIINWEAIKDIKDEAELKAAIKAQEKEFENVLKTNPSQVVDLILNMDEVSKKFEDVLSIRELRKETLEDYENLMNGTFDAEMTAKVAEQTKKEQAEARAKSKSEREAAVKAKKAEKAKAKAKPASGIEEILNEETELGEETAEERAAKEYFAAALREKEERIAAEKRAQAESPTPKPEAPTKVAAKDRIKDDIVKAVLDSYESNVDNLVAAGNVEGLQKLRAFINKPDNAIHQGTTEDPSVISEALSDLNAIIDSAIAKSTTTPESQASKVENLTKLLRNMLIEETKKSKAAEVAEALEGVLDDVRLNTGTANFDKLSAAEQFDLFAKHFISLQNEETFTELFPKIKGAFMLVRGVEVAGSASQILSRFRPAVVVSTEAEIANKIRELIEKQVVIATKDKYHIVGTTQDGSVEYDYGRVRDGHNIFAFLSRAYYNLFDPDTRVLKIKDKDNKLLKNNHVEQPSKYTAGTKIILKVDFEFEANAGAFDESGNTTNERITYESLRQKGIAEGNENKYIPIGIYDAADQTIRLGHIHDVNWINNKKVFGSPVDLDSQRIKLQQIREHVINNREVETTISDKTYGHLIRNAKKEIKKVSEGFPASTVKFSIGKGGAYRVGASEFADGDIINLRSKDNQVIEGATYMLLPIRREDHGNGMRMQYIAVPVYNSIMPKSDAEVVIQALRLYVDGPQNEAETAMAEDLSAAGFDIVANRNDLIRFISQFIHNFSTPDSKSLAEHLVREKSSARRFSITTNLIQYGKGASLANMVPEMEFDENGNVTKVRAFNSDVGSVQTKTSDQGEAFEKLKEMFYVGLMKQMVSETDIPMRSHAQIESINSNKPIYSIVDGKVQKVANNYNEFLKERTESDLTSLPLEINGEVTYINTIQPIISFDTKFLSESRQEPKPEVNPETTTVTITVNDVIVEALSIGLLTKEQADSYKQNNKQFENFGVDQLSRFAEKNNVSKEKVIDIANKLDRIRRVDTTTVNINPVTPNTPTLENPISPSGETASDIDADPWTKTNYLPGEVKAPKTVSQFSDILSTFRGNYFNPQAFGKPSVTVQSALAGMPAILDPYIKVVQTGEYVRLYAKRSNRPLDEAEYQKIVTQYTNDYKSNAPKTQIEHIRDTYFNGSNETTANDVLVKISNSRHPLNKLAAHLLKYLNRNVKINLDERLDVNHGGVYYRDTDSIIIYGNKKLKKSVEVLLLHEVLHALSSHALFINSQFSKDFRNLHEAAVRELGEYNSKTGVGEYSLKNEREFLVGLFTDSSFIIKLQGIAATNSNKYKNLFQEITDYLLSLLKITPNSSLYNEAVALATNIINVNEEARLSIDEVFNVNISDEFGVVDRNFLPLTQEEIEKNSEKLWKDVYIPALGLRRQVDLVRSIVADINAKLSQLSAEEAADGVSLNRIMNEWKAYYQKKLDYYKGLKHEVAISNLQAVIDNWDQLNRLVKSELTALSGVSIEEYESDGFEESDSDNQKENFDKDASLKENRFKKASSRIKRFFYNIHNRKRVERVENGETIVTYERFKNSVDFWDIVDPNTVYATLLVNLVNLDPNLDLMLAKLRQDVLPAHPWVQDVIDKLENAPEDVKNAFVVLMTNHKVEYSSISKRKVWFKDEKTGLRGVNFYVRNMKSNLNDFTIGMADNWEAAFISHGFIDWIDEDNGTFRINKDFGNRVVALLDAAAKEPDKKTSLRYLAKAFGEMGIVLNTNALEDLYDNGLYIGGSRVPYENLFSVKGGVFKVIIDRLQSEETFNASDERLFRDSSVIQLARHQAKHSDVSQTVVYTRGDGEQIQSTAKNKYVSHRFNRLLTDKSLLHELSTISFTKDNPYLALLLADDSVLKNYMKLEYSDTIVEFGEHSAYEMLSEKNEVAVEEFKFGKYTNAGAHVQKQRLIQLMLPTMGDGGTLMHYQTVAHETQIDATTGKIKQRTVDAIYDSVVKPEVNRIVASKGKPDTNIKGYDKGKNKFIILWQLNEIAKKHEVGTHEFEQAAKAKIRDIVTEMVANKIEQWKRIGILKYFKGDEEQFIRGYWGFHSLDTTFIKKVFNSIKGVDKIQYFASDFVVNYLIGNSNTMALLGVDPAMYYESKNDYSNESLNDQASSKATFDTISKRLSMFRAPGEDIVNTSDDKILLLFAKDGKFQSDNDKYVAKFGLINGTDGQEFVTTKEYLHVLHNHGRITKEKADEYLKKHNNEELSDEEIKFLSEELIFNPIKPVYGNVIGKDDMLRPIYIKSSAFPLIKQLTQGLELEKLRLKMEAIEAKEKTPARLVFDSAIKVGGLTNSVNIWNADGTIKDDIDFTNSSLIVPRSGFRIQQDTPYHEDSRRRVATQPKKLAFVNILGVDGFNFEGQTLTGKQLHDIYNDTYKQLYQQLLKDTDAEFKNVDGSLNLTKIEAILQKEADLRGFNIFEKQGLVIDPETGKFKNSLALSPMAARYEALLNSLVDNRIRKIEMSGTSFILGTQEGFISTATKKEVSDESRIAENKGIIFTPEWTGKLKSNEILVKPIFRDNSGKVINLRAKDKEGKYIWLNEDGTVNMDKFDSDLFNIFGFRIPYQGHSSGFMPRIVGFLPITSGDLVIASRDGIARAGWDFDIDKLYSYLYNHFVETIVTEDTTTNAEGESVTNVIETNKVLRNSYSHISDINTQLGVVDSKINTLRDNLREKLNSSSQLRKEIRDILAENEQVEVDTSELDNLISETRLLEVEIDKAMIDKEIDNMKNLLSKLVARRNRLKKAYRNSLENRIIDVHASISQNENEIVTSQHTNPLNEGILRQDGKVETLVDEVYEARNKPEFFSGYDDSYQTQKFFEGRDGQIGIAVFSTYSVLFALTQNTQMFVGTREKDGVVPLDLQFGDKIGNDINSPYAIDNLEDLPYINRVGGRLYKSEVNSWYQSATVDNFKHGTMPRANINKYTFNVIGYMTYRGFVRETIPFINQPIIYEFLEEVKKLENKIQDANGDPMAKAYANLISRYEREIKSISGEVDYTKLAEYETTATGFNDLMDYIKQDGDPRLTKADDYALKQLAILNKFIGIQEVAKELQHLSSAIAVDSKGFGTNIFESMYKEQQLLRLYNNPYFINADQLIGTYISSDHYNRLSFEEQKEYTRVGSMYIKPTSTPGFASVYGLVYNNNLWKETHPEYHNLAIQTLMEHIITIGNDTRDAGAKNYAKKQQQVWNAIKAYIYSLDSVGVSQDTASVKRIMLLADVSEKIDGELIPINESLGTKITNFRNTPIGNRPFLRKLQVKNKNGFQIITLNNLVANPVGNNTIYQDIIDMIYSPVEISEGYTTRDMIDDLISYSYLTGAKQGYTDFLRYIPYGYLEMLQIPQNASSVRLNEVFGRIVSPNNPYDLHPFIVEYFAHNPHRATLVDNIKLFESGFKLGTNTARLRKDEKGLNPLYVSRSIDRDGETRKELVPPEFISVKNYDSPKTYDLYKYDPVSDSYRKMKPLGTPDVLEYNISGDGITRDQNSIREERKENKPVPPQLEPQTPSKIPINTLLKNYYHLNEKISDVDKIDNILSGIAAKSENPVFRFLSTKMRKLVKLYDIKIILKTDPGFKAALERLDGKYKFQLTINDNITDQKEFELAILHELIHAITKNAIEFPADNTKAQNDALRRLTGYFNEVKRKFEEKYPEEFKELKTKLDKLERQQEGSLKTGEKIAFTSREVNYLYGGTDLYEFLSLAATSYNFQVMLASTPYTENKSFLQEFIDRVVDVFRELFAGFIGAEKSILPEIVRDIFIISDPSYTLVNQAVDKSPIEGIKAQNPTKSAGVQGVLDFETDLSNESDTLLDGVDNTQVDEDIKGLTPDDSAQVAESSPTFLEHGTYYRFQLVDGKAISGEYSQGNTNDWKPLKDHRVEGIYLRVKDLKRIDESTKDLVDTLINGKPLNEPTPDKSSAKYTFTYKGKTIATEFQLSKDQSQALEQLIDFVLEGNKDHPIQNAITMEGAAGTGKTSIIGYLKLYLANYRPVYMAPTHAATAQLAVQTSKIGNTDLPMTVQSALAPKTIKGVNGDERVYVLSRKAQSRITFNSYIVVDESSMLDLADFNNLLEAAKSAGVRVIFMGDWKQIPKVSQSTTGTKPVSAAFTKVKKVTLTTVHRQKSNRLIDLLQTIRNQIITKFFKIENTDNVKFLNGGDFNIELKKDLDQDPENTVVVTYTNNSVSRYNSNIRSYLGRTGSPKVGDVLMGYLGYASKQIEKGNMANSISYVINQVDIVDGVAHIYGDSKILSNLQDLGFKISGVGRLNYYQLSTTDSLTFDELTEKDFENNNAKVSEIFKDIYETIVAFENKKISYNDYLQAAEQFSIMLADFSVGDKYIYNPATKRMEIFSDTKHKHLSKFTKGRLNIIFDKDIDYGHAITIHKSQGASIGNVYFDTAGLSKIQKIDIVDEQGNTITTEAQSLYYVGSSRAVNKLVVNTGDNHFEDLPSTNYLPSEDVSYRLVNNEEYAQANIDQQQTYLQSLVSKIKDLDSRIETLLSEDKYDEALVLAEEHKSLRDVHDDNLELLVQFIQELKELKSSIRTLDVNYLPESVYVGGERITINNPKVEVVVKERVKEINRLKRDLSRVSWEGWKISKIENYETRINQLEHEVKDIARIENLEALFTHAIEDYKLIEKLLQEDMSESDILRVDKKISLWSNIVNLLFDPSEIESSTLVNGFEVNGVQTPGFATLEVMFKRFKGKLYNIKLKHIESAIKEKTGKDIDILEEFAKQGDVSFLKSYTVGLGRVNSTLLQFIDSTYQDVISDAKQDWLDKAKEVDSMVNKAMPTMKRLAEAGKPLFQFMKQLTKDGLETGNIISPVSHSYNQARADAMAKAKANPTTGWKAYRQWKKNNQILFDTRILFPTDEHYSETENGIRKVYTSIDRDNHIAELKEHMGEAVFNQLYKTVEERMEIYDQLAIEKKEELASDLSLTQDDRDLLFLDWDKENSPHWYVRSVLSASTLLDQFDETISPRGWQYTMSMPRAFTEKDGVRTATEWYDERFKTIERSPELYELYTFVLDTIQELNKYLPSDKRDELTYYELPSLRQDLIDVLHSKGMKGVTVEVFDRFIQDITSKQNSEIAQGEIDHNGRMDREQQINFLKDNRGAIQNIKQRMIIDFEQKNGFAPTDAEKREMGLKAQDEVMREKSWDVSKVLKMYAALVMSYQAKARIEDLVNIAKNVIDEAQEPTLVNIGGKAVLRNKPASESYKNMKDMFEYWMQWFYGKRHKDEFWVKDRTVKRYTSSEKKVKAELEELLAENERLFAEEAIDEPQYDKTKAVLERQLNELGGYFTDSKFWRQFLKFIQLRGMGWNVFSGFSNMGFGLPANLVEASDGRVFNTKQLMRAYGMTLNSVLKNFTFNKVETSTAKKIRNMMDGYDFLRDSSNELYSRTSDNMFRRKLKFLEPYNIQQRTEYINQAPIIIATLLNIEVVDDNGNRTNLWDAHDENGKLRSNFKNLQKAVLRKSLNKAGQIRDNIHGNYDPEKPLMINDKVIGTASKQFKTWMFENFAQRFEGELHDSMLDMQRKGRYRTVYQLIGAGKSNSDYTGYSNLMFTVGQLMKKLSFGAFGKTKFDERFNEVDAANMRKVLTEIIIYGSIVALIAVIKGLKAGDDDKKSSEQWAYNYILNQITRINTDLLMYLSPEHFQALVRNPLPALVLIVDGFKLITVAGNAIAGNDTIPTGVYAGDSKLTRELSKMFPLWTQLRRTKAASIQVFDK